jgi:hypothetical protein
LVARYAIGDTKEMYRRHNPSDSELDGGRRAARDSLGDVTKFRIQYLYTTNVGTHCPHTHAGKREFGTLYRLVLCDGDIA